MLRYPDPLQGDELKFLCMTDSIRKECRAIDKNMIGLPELRLVILAFEPLYCSLWLVHRLLFHRASLCRVHWRACF